MTGRARQGGQALAVPATPVPVDGPTGFDPSRCRNCGGDGWVCENHPDAPWNDSMKFGCECGAGAPCPVCNPLHDSGPAERERSRILTWLKAMPEHYSGWNDFDEHFDNGHASALATVIEGIKKREDHAIATEAGTATTTEIGVAEGKGAGPKDIAQKDQQNDPD